MDAPQVPQDLLEYLQTIYPDQMPSPNIGETALWTQIGQVSVVRHLSQLFDEQNETIIG